MGSSSGLKQTTYLRIAGLLMWVKRWRPFSEQHNTLLCVQFVTHRLRCAAEVTVSVWKWAALMLSDINRSCIFGNAFLGYIWMCCHKTTNSSCFFMHANKTSYIWCKLIWLRNNNHFHSLGGSRHLLKPFNERNLNKVIRRRIRSE